MSKIYLGKYWEHKGNFQEEYNKLYSKLVPSKGSSSTKHGELLRCISKLYYDLFNNGLCNYDVLYENCIENLLRKDSIEVLQEFGLEEKASTIFKKEFYDEPKRCPYRVKRVVSAIDCYVDSVIKYCIHEESKFKKQFIKNCIIK